MANAPLSSSLYRCPHCTWPTIAFAKHFKFSVIRWRTPPPPPPSLAFSLRLKHVDFWLPPTIYICMHLSSSGRQVSIYFSLCSCCGLYWIICLRELPLPTNHIPVPSLSPFWSRSPGDGDQRIRRSVVATPSPWLGVIIRLRQIIMFYYL